MTELSRSTSPVFAATDMLHRRTPLPHSFVARCGVLSVAIRANDPVVAQGFLEENAEDRLAPAISGNEWQIEITLDDSANSAAFEHRTWGAEVFAFGPSRAIRFANGSWFAHTPPSADGVGFFRLSVDANSRLRQFEDLLRDVASFVLDERSTAGPPGVLEVVA